MVSARDFPSDSLLRADLATATFSDCYESALGDPTLTPVAILRRTVMATPGWAETLMSIRNRAVRPLGLKTGARPFGVSADKLDADVDVGDRFGLFTVLAKADDEVVLGVDDRHLDVRLSVKTFTRDGVGRYALSTVVKTHNLLGRLYMIPVGRIHPIIVRSMMRRAEV